jgi:energy-converting hydrogenase A subunit R
MLEDIDPVGGKAKAEAILTSLEITRKQPVNVIYIGDSITDAEALRFVKAGGGLAVSFNGNRYAFTFADIACISENTIVTSILIDCFDKHQKAGVIDLVGNHWNPEGFREFHLDPSLIEPFEKLLSQSKQLNASVISDSNREKLIKESEIMRKSVRGLAIGKLG